MAFVTVTAANVRPTTTRARPVSYEASQAITAGMVVHLDATTNKVAKATSETASLNVVGISMSNASADGDFIYVQNSGEIDTGGTVTEGARYYLSENPGIIGQFSDLSAGEYVEIYYATSASTAVIDITQTGVVI